MSYFSPMGAYGFIWALLLGLFFLRIISYPPLSFETKAAIFGSYFFLIIGSLMVPLARYRVDQNAYAKDNKCFIEWQPLRRLTLFLSILSLLGAIEVFWEVYKIFGIEGMTLGESRYELMSNEININIVWGILFSFVFPTSVLSGVLFANGEWRYYPLYIPLFAALIWSLAYTGRGTLLMVILSYLVGYFLIDKVLSRRRSLNPKKLLITGLAITVFFAVSSYIYNGRGGLYYATFLEEHYSNYPINPWLFAYYRYFTGPFAALDYFINNFDGNYAWGTSILYPLFHQLENLGLIKLAFKQGINMPAVEVPIKINVFTYLRAIYTDFGLPGTIIVPLVLGFISSSLYLKYLRIPSVSKLLVLSYFYVLFLTSPYEYMLFQPTTWFSLFITLLFIRVIERRGYVSKPIHNSSQLQYPRPIE
ncbi:MAG: O-antigen polymerase [Actinomycetota bacterium]|nr:O-antigen polymerase [Actinomycetota bacterium]